MMGRIRVRLKERSYDILTGSGVLGRSGAYLSSLNIGKDAYIITNSLLKIKYGDILAGSLSAKGFNVRFKTVPDSEKSKSLKTACPLLKNLAFFDKNRKVFIVAFGGGVIGDLAGFIAAVYKRGIPYIQVPTTLLAQVDASIGGKTALDLDAGKNLVGAFYQPKIVLSDTGLLKSLARRQISSGMAEVIKYAIIGESGLFTYLEKNRDAVFSFRPAALERIISSCAKIKAGIVERDEKETLGLRTVLNFGHTMGHAIESASAYRTYNHGEAVALGIITACDLSRRMGLIGDKLFLRIRNLISAYHLPVKLKGVSLHEVVKAHYHDKKFSGKENKLVLIRGLSRPVAAKNVPLALIKQSLSSIF